MGRTAVLPAERDLERMVLGICLIQPGSLPAITDQLEADDFYLEPHRRIFSAIADMAKSGRHVDHATVATELNKRKHLESIGGLAYLVEMDSQIPQISDVDSYIETLRRKSMARQAAQRFSLAAESICAGNADLEEISEVQRFLESLTARAQSSKSGLLSLEEYLDANGGMDAVLGPNRDTAVPTPWPTLSRDLKGRGFLPGQLVILAARPAMGKTTMGLVLAVEASRAGFPTTFFSLEMRSSELWQKCVGMESGVPGGQFRDNPAPTDDRNRKIHGAASTLASFPLWIDDAPNTTVASLLAKVERHRARGRATSMVIVDYLQLLTVSGSRRSRVEEVTEITRQLKLAAKRLNVPIVVCAQINRESPKEDKEPELHHLRESGSVEQDADIVIMLHQSAKDKAVAIETKSPGRVKMLVRKNRLGPTGWVPMIFDFRLMRITEEGNEQ